MGRLTYVVRVAGRLDERYESITRAREVASIHAAIGHRHAKLFRELVRDDGKIAETTKIGEYVLPPT